MSAQEGTGAHDAASIAGSAALSQIHLAQLAESGIDEATSRRHRFRTVTTWQELVEVGFPEKQAKRLVKHLPGLLVPSWGPDGQIAGWQLRLDKPPPVGGKGHKQPLRYVGPDGGRNAIDF